MADKKQFTKVITQLGQEFYARETDRATLMLLPGFKRAEDVWMTEEEFNAIPATPEAESFFKGESKSARAGE